MKYFYDNTNTCYLFIEIRNRYCRTTGDILGKEVLGKKIKTSGVVSNTVSVMCKTQLHVNSSLMLTQPNQSK